MIVGPVGVGKTTYLRRLVDERRAVPFVLDEWMAQLFAPDAPATPDLQWALARTARCEERIAATARAVLEAGVDVVVELGFFRRAQRDAFRARPWDASIVVHALTAPVDVRRARVRARNAGAPTVHVDDAMFEWAEGFFEPLADDELVGAVRVDTTG